MVLPVSRLRCYNTLGVLAVVCCHLYSYPYFPSSSAPGKNMSSFIELDGSQMEGGGQIFRLAMSISLLAQKPVRVINIRGGRDKPGLKPQHLESMNLLKKMSNYKSDVTTEPSTTVEFTPGSLVGGQFESNCQTAGSISLIIQAAFPVALFGDKETHLTISGGTNTQWSPPIDYLKNVFMPLAEQFGASSSLDIKRRGFYPRGGGLVKLYVLPVQKLKAVHLEDPGDVVKIWGTLLVSHKFNNKVHDLIQICKKKLEPFFQNEVYINVEKFQLTYLTATICLFAETSNGCRYGTSRIFEKGTDVFNIATEASDELLEILQSEVCLDPHSQDQVIILMALAQGESAFKVGPITSHAQTAIRIIEKLTEVRFSVVPIGKDVNLLKCTGMGLENTKL